VTQQRPTGGENGFTLLEVLVALVVLGMLVIGLSQGVRTGLALRQAQVHRLDATAELDSAMRLLRTVLSRLPAAPGGRVLGAKSDSAFKGDPGEVRFLGTLPTGLGATRRAEMTLHLRNGRLILSWSPRLHEQPLKPPQPATDTELLHGVARLDLAYWGPGPGNEPAGWRSSWDEADMPQLIRVRLGFGEKDRRRWPDLIAAARP